MMTSATLSAMTRAQEASGASEITGVDLATYGGIAIAVSILVEVFKWLVGEKVKGKEPWIAFILVFVVGILSKIELGFYETVPWTYHVVMLIVTVGGAYGVHNGLINPLGKGGKKAGTGTGEG